MPTISLMWPEPPEELDPFDVHEVLREEIFEKEFGLFPVYETYPLAEAAREKLGVRVTDAESKLEFVFVIGFGMYLEDEIRYFFESDPRTAVACAVLTIWGAETGPEAERRLLASVICKQISIALGREPTVLTGLPGMPWPW